MPSKEVGCYDEINHFLELGYINIYELEVENENKQRTNGKCNEISYRRS